jgi:nucleotide-binding universal stress UspA family protein
VFRLGSMNASVGQWLTTTGAAPSSSAMHRMVGSVAVNLAHHSPVPVTIVP